MSHKQPAASAPSQPHRALRTDFTADTLRYATTAKRRVKTKQQVKAFFKEPFSMKSLIFLRTVPGAMLAVAIIATTSASAYALTNWFNGDVTVKQNASVLSVDLSTCKGSLPPGVDPSTDKQNVPFKILGNPHISAEQLQHQLLAKCEYNAVIDLHRSNPDHQNDSFYSSTVKSINADGTVTLDYLWGGRVNEKTFTIPAAATIYDKGKKITSKELKAGDMVVFAIEPPAYVEESTDPLAGISQLQSIFKTQYDTREAPGKDFYDTSNIMPLDWYNQVHKQ
jgi:hypothetical protein